MVDVSIIAAIITVLYADECDIYRYTEQTDSFGGTRLTRGSPTLAGVRCLISHANADDASKRLNSHIPPTKRIALHVTPNTDLRAGDFVVARKRSRGQVVCTYQGTVGEPAVYPSHIRADLMLDEAAQP
jgi:hypothetical protein